MEIGLTEEQKKIVENFDGVDPGSFIEAALAGLDIPGFIGPAGWLWHGLMLKNAREREKLLAFCHQSEVEEAYARGREEGLAEGIRAARLNARTALEDVPDVDYDD